LGGLGADEGHSVAVDGAGNAFVTGSFEGTVDFGGGALVSAGGVDIFLAKYNSSGNHVWSKRFGAAATDHGYSVALDVAGNVFVTGDFAGTTVDFGGGPLASSGLSYEGYIAKYDAAGNHLWSKPFGPGSEGRSVVVDVAGNAFATGSFSGTVDFGGGPLVAVGNLDTFLVKYDAAGNHLWSKSFGGPQLEGGNSVAVDGVGNVLIAGTMMGTVDLGGGPLVTAGGRDVFLAKYNSGGNHLWSKRFGGGGEDFAPTVAVEGAGSAFFTGTFQGTVNFGGGGLVSAGGYDGFVARYDAAGNHVWSKRFGTAGPDFGRFVAVDGSGNALVTGRFGAATIEFGGGPLVSAGSFEGFLVRYDAAGNHLWNTRYGGAGADDSHSVAVDGAGNAFVTGFFENTGDFGGGPLVSAGGTDVFLAKYGPWN